MIKKYKILKFHGEDHSVEQVLSGRYEIETEIYDSSFSPSRKTFYIILFNEKNLSDEIEGMFIKLVNAKTKFIVIASVISYNAAVRIHKYASDIIFMPATAGYIQKKIDSAAAEKSADHANFVKRIIYRQFDNIRHLQRIFISLYRNDPLMQSRVLNIAEEASDRRRETEKLIKEAVNALKNGHFEMFFQPVVDISTNSITGFESLIRWNDPEKGIIPPDDFIPAIEASDFIFELTYWIIEDVISFIAELNKRQFPGKRINVNICAKHFHLEKLVETIESYREKYKIDARQLGIEITESAFMEDMKIANLNLLKLKSLDYPLYMDDFGTGYSSLSYLQHFPVEIIKIDKSFVRWMHVDEQSELIVRSVIALAHGLKMKVVAEGVEEDEHIEILKSLGCEYGQGYFYSRPLDKEGVLNFLNEYGS